MKIIKNIFLLCKNKLNLLYSKWITYCNNNFGDTDRSIYWLSTVLASLILGVVYADSGLPVIIGFLLATLVGFILINLLFGLVVLIIKILLRKSIHYLVQVSFLIAVFATFILNSGYGILNKPESVIVAFVIVWLIHLFVRSAWAFFKHRIHTISVILTMIVTGVFSISVGVFLASQGFDDDYIEEYLKLNPKIANESSIDEAFKVELEIGAHKVATLDYGTKETADLKSNTYNMSWFVGGYKGYQAFYRKMVQGYDIEKVPLAGRVWYPEEKKNCPVLFIVHGNHNLTTPSYLGYDYLGEYLASHGIVVVSVDQNFCNGSNFGNLEQENDGRAILLLENIKQVQKFNLDINSKLFQKMDYDNIAIAGHSRGGEAVAIAALFNKYAYYPSNGVIPLNYHFNIKSVIAIAPSVNQYRPADHDVNIKDINYLLIHGANDQDVSCFMGSRQFKNITFSGDGDYFKTSLYIAGANHGQFNSKWGRYDYPMPWGYGLNVANLLDEKEQQTILKGYVKEFLDCTLRNSTKYKDIFYDFHKYQPYFAKTVFIQNYADSSFETVCDYEEDSDLTTGTKDGTSIRTYGMNIWAEKMMQYSALNGERGNYALRLSWLDNRVAGYEINMSSYNGKNKYLQFDILDADNSLVKQKQYSNLNCYIRLADENRKQVSVQLKDFYTIYPPLPVKLGKFQYLLNKTEFKHQLQTVRIPVKDIIGDSIDFDDTKIKKISFIFSANGSRDIELDNIGFGSVK